MVAICFMDSCCLIQFLASKKIIVLVLLFFLVKAWSCGTSNFKLVSFHGVNTLTYLFQIYLFRHINFQNTLPKKTPFVGQVQEHIAMHFIALAPSPYNMRHRILRARKAIYSCNATYIWEQFIKEDWRRLEKKVMHWYVYISVNNLTWPWNKVSAHKGNSMLMNIKDYFISSIYWSLMTSHKSLYIWCSSTVLKW